MLGQNVPSRPDTVMYLLFFATFPPRYIEPFIFNGGLGDVVWRC